MKINFDQNSFYNLEVELLEALHEDILNPINKRLSKINWNRLNNDIKILVIDNTICDVMGNNKSRIRKINNISTNRDYKLMIDDNFKLLEVKFGIYNDYILLKMK